MRIVCLILAAAISALPARAEEKKIGTREIDKQLYEVLKDIHNRGADIFNAGDTTACYRLFQGSLQTARAVLAHRPADQKFIDDSLAQVERLPTIEKRAFALHDVVVKLRERLRMAPPEANGEGPEYLTVQPREVKVEKKEAVPKKVVPPMDGVMGRLIWQGRLLAGAEVTFVSRGSLELRVFEGVTDSEGVYVFEKVKPGRYTVLLTQPGAKPPLLPERYASTTTSPLIVDVKGGGDTLDFLLQ
jgi:hypothetical protein